MKKKLFSALCVALGSVLLVGCNQASQKLQFNTNWSLNTMNDTPISTTETLTYDVDFLGLTFLQAEHFTVQYCKDETGKTKLGSYVTTLEGKGDGYVYTTTLKVPVSYTFQGETIVFEDVVTTSVEFKNAKLSLAPISSVKTVECHSPRNAAPSSLEECYIDYSYSVTTTYNESCTEGTSVMLDTSAKGTLYDKAKYPEGQTTTFAIDGEKYSYLDNEQLLFALRGLSNSSLSAAKSVSVYNSSKKNVQLVSIQPGSSSSEKYSFTLGGTSLPENTAIEYTPVQISLPKGASQTLHYARTTDDANNVYRNVLLYMEVPVAYNIGYLKYTLKDAVFANN